MSKFDMLKKAAPKVSGKEQIDAVERITKAQQSNSKTMNLNIAKISLNPHNDYGEEDTVESVRDFADTISREGLLHNLVVSAHQDGDKESYVLISGERRLKAIRLLARDINEPVGKWDEVRCLVMYGLTERQEMIFLDAANLETRGGVGNELLVRKAISRYVDNLKAEYNISDKVAKDIVEKLGLKRILIDKNLRIEKATNRDIVKMLDEGTITKKEAIAFASFSEEEQSTIANTLSLLAEKAAAGNADSKKAFDECRSNICDCVSVQNRHEKADKLADIITVAKETSLKLAEEPDDESDAQEPTAVATYMDRYMMKCDKFTNFVSQLSGPKGKKRLKGSSPEQVDELVKKLDEMARTIAYVRDGLK